MKHKKKPIQYALISDSDIYVEYESLWYIMSYTYNKYNKKTYYSDNEFSVRLNDIGTALSNDFHKIIYL